MVLKPAELSLGSAAIHIRSSPTTCVDAGFGEMKLLPSSVDLPVVMLTSWSRLEKARLSALGAGKPGSTAVSRGPIAQSQSPPPALWSGAPMNLALEPSCVTRIASHWPPVGPITNDSPALLVRMLGSAAFWLPGSSRFGLNERLGALAADTPTGPRPIVAKRATAAATDARRFIGTRFIFSPTRSFEVVATDAVDLERHRVRLRGRVVLRAFLDGCRHRVAAHGFEQARRGRSADVSDVDADGQRARTGRRAADRAGLRLARESRPGRPGLRVRQHVREACRDGAEVDRPLRARVEDGPVQRRVLHGGVVDGVAHLPARDVLHVCRARHGANRGGRVGQVGDLHRDLEGVS